MPGLRLGRAALRAGQHGCSRVRLALGALLMLALVLAACGGPAASSTPPPTDEPSAETSEEPSPFGSEEPSIVVVPDSPVAGIVLTVDSSGLNDVRGFTLRSNSGETLTFVIGTLENGDEFPPGHLTEHMAAASPILVFFREENDELVVFRIEDAG